MLIEHTFSDHTIVRMSALGQKRTFAPQAHVRFTPESDRNNGHCRSLKGRALLLCPVVSDVDLLRYGEGIVHIDAEIPHGALYLGVTEQKLDGAQIPGAAVDKRRLSAPQ